MVFSCKGVGIDKVFITAIFKNPQYSIIEDKIMESYIIECYTGSTNDERTLHTDNRTTVKIPGGGKESQYQKLYGTFLLR